MTHASVMPWMAPAAVMSAVLLLWIATIRGDGRPAGDGLVNVQWQWEQTIYGDDQKAVPADPARYTLTFNPDGTLAIRADCNRAGGTYTVEGQHIEITVTHSTMAACPPDSRERHFLKDLSAAAIFFFKEGRLCLDLKYDSGTMRFKP